METNRDVLTTYTILEQKLESYTGEVAFAVSLNMDMMESTVKAVRAAGKASADVEAYEKARIELCQKHADKDTAGEPQMVNNNFVITDPEFKDAAAKLKAKYIVAMNEHEKRQEEAKALLDKPAPKFKFEKIKKEQLKKLKIDALAMRPLLKFL